MTNQPGAAGRASARPAFDLRGAVDLGALAARGRPDAGRSAAARSGDGGAGSAGAAGSDQDGGAPGPSGHGGPFVREVTEQTFATDVIETSSTVPVVIDLWATWCGPCRQLSPILEALAAEYDGRFLLATVDVDANQQLAAAFGVQSIPSVFAVVKGQPLPLFTGALPEPQVRQYITELLRVAEANGVSGRLPGGDGEAMAEAEPEEEPLPPLHEEAYQAIERDDLDAAVAAYRQALRENPGDDLARVGLAQVELLRRTAAVDPVAARAAAAADPSDVPAQLLAADLDLLGGHVGDAFGRLVELVRRTSGPEREQARKHLVGLFELIGADDPRVAKARVALASALF